MRLIKIGLANINTTVGAFRRNIENIIVAAEHMAVEKCSIGCFQEQTISGYPAEDLVQWPAFVEKQWKELMRFVGITRRLNLDTTFTIGVTVAHNGHVYNAVAVVQNGKILGIVPKEKLPTYNVFYEWRTFSPGFAGMAETIEGIPFGDLIFKANFGTFAVEVCEDIWSPDGPMRRRSYSGAELIINASASPCRFGVLNTRREMISTRAADNQVTIAYVNQVGGNDSLVFDGGGFINQNGRMIAEAPRWREQIFTQVVDLDRTTTRRYQNTTWRTDNNEFLRTNKTVPVVSIPESMGANKGYAYPCPKEKSFFLPTAEIPKSPLEEMFEDTIEALIMSLDYLEKTKVFKRIGISLSGGKDSGLALIIAALYARRKFAHLNSDQHHLYSDRHKEAIKDFIHCFSMPTRFNSSDTKSIARDLAEEFGASFSEHSIEEAFEREVAAAQHMLGPEKKLTSNTLQNIQARIRGERMWNWSNSTQALWIQTSNMSEVAVGYTTIGGDMMGGYSLFKNLPKTFIIELLKYLGEKYNSDAIRRLVAKDSSAELAENQADERDLMPFPVLDACFALFAGERMMPREVYMALRAMWTDNEFKAMDPAYAEGTLKKWVVKFHALFLGSIFKWVQTPQGVHLGTLDLDRERALQLPVVQSKEWIDIEKELENLP